MGHASNRAAKLNILAMLGGLIVIAGIGFAVLKTVQSDTSAKPEYRQRKRPDTAGFQEVCNRMPAWSPTASLQEIADIWRGVGYRNIEAIDGMLAKPDLTDVEKFNLMMAKAILFNYENEPKKAYATQEEMRRWLEERPELAKEDLYTVIYFQGITGLRLGETENCVMCRGESSCILPIAPSAVHKIPEGSRLAIRHFTEYLERFPDDLEVRWLLNIAHMTLGEHPDKVNPKFLVSLDHYLKNEFNIGKFRDIGELVGVNRFNMAGGAVMEDFDKDGKLDLAVTTFNPVEHMIYYHNTGDGTFEDRTESAGSRGSARRQESRPNRLQQRRQSRHLHLPRGLAESPDAAVVAPK